MSCNEVSTYRGETVHMIAGVVIHLKTLDVVGRAVEFGARPSHPLRALAL